MHRINSYIAALMLSAVVFFSCTQDQDVSIAPDVQNAEVSDEIRSQIVQLGFDASDVTKERLVDPITNQTEDFFRVEKDILLSPDHLVAASSEQPRTEQYRAPELIGTSTKNFIVSINRRSIKLFQVVSEAVAEFNDLNLQFKFNVVLRGAHRSPDIQVSVSSSQPGFASFPHDGEPGSIRLTTDEFDADRTTLKHLLMHRLGHTIGMHHTDSGSPLACTGDITSSVQAIHIAGTPTGVDANSVMLSCPDTWTTGKFSSDDVKALETLYPRIPEIIGYRVKYSGTHTIPSQADVVQISALVRKSNGSPTHVFRVDMDRSNLTIAPGELFVDFNPVRMQFTSVYQNYASVDGEGEGEWDCVETSFLDLSGPNTYSHTHTDSNCGGRYGMTVEVIPVYD